MKIQQSAENYLETIFVLTKRNGVVRSIDIANELGFSKPSVSVAMKSLRENGCIDVMGDGHIILLPEGRKIAEKLYERHTVLTNALVSLGVSEEDETFEAIKNYHNKIKAWKNFRLIFLNLLTIMYMYSIMYIYW